MRCCRGPPTPPPCTPPQLVVGGRGRRPDTSPHTTPLHHRTNNTGAHTPTPPTTPPPPLPDHYHTTTTPSTTSRLITINKSGLWYHNHNHPLHHTLHHRHHHLTTGSQHNTGHTYIFKGFTCCVHAHQQLRGALFVSRDTRCSNKRSPSNGYNLFSCRRYGYEPRRQISGGQVYVIPRRGGDSSLIRCSVFKQCYSYEGES